MHISRPRLILCILPPSVTSRGADSSSTARSERSLLGKSCSHPCHPSRGGVPSERSSSLALVAWTVSLPLCCALTSVFAIGVCPVVRTQCQLTLHSSASGAAVMAGEAHPVVQPVGLEQPKLHQEAQRTATGLTLRHSPAGLGRRVAASSAVDPASAPGGAPCSAGWQGGPGLQRRRRRRWSRQ